jgi:hypothetical protein
MALKRELEENPYAAPLNEDFLKSAWKYRDRFEEKEEFHEALELWPRCPQCGRRRITRCPICKSSGDLFPLAAQEYFNHNAPPIKEPPSRVPGAHACATCSVQREDDEDVIEVESRESGEERAQVRRRAWAQLAHKLEKSELDRQPALLCYICSEAFIPVFPRYCEWCDHDFGAGEEYEVDGTISEEVVDFMARKSQEKDAALEPNSHRVLLTLLALLAIFVFFLGYWFYILGPS